MTFGGRLPAYQDVWIEFDGLDCNVKESGDVPDTYIKCERKGRYGLIGTGVRQDTPNSPWWGEPFRTSPSR